MSKNVYKHVKSSSLPIGLGYVNDLFCDYLGKPSKNSLMKLSVELFHNLQLLLWTFVSLDTFLNDMTGFSCLRSCKSHN